jgi:Na+/H+ antiporter NhaC
MGDNQKNLDSAIGPIAFTPLIVFMALYLGFGLYFYFQGAEGPFNYVPREAALMFAIFLAILMGKGTFSERTNNFMECAAKPSIIMQCFIFILAGIFSVVSKSIGGVDAVVNAGMSIMPHNLIVAGLFVISCLISISMGTSFGTISAVAPIAVGFSESGGYNIALVLCAVIGGAMFGDNLSFISDTTIAATQGAGCEMNDKFKMNFKIALPAAVIATVLYAIWGKSETATALNNHYTIEYIKILPYALVLLMAFCGLNVIYVLGLGIVFSALAGFYSGTLDFFSLCSNMKKGINGMYSICLMAFALKGIIGRIQTMGGIDWIISKATRNIKSRRGAQYFIAAFVSIIDVCIGNNAICIIICADVLKPIAKKFKIAPQRFASLLDIFACIIPGLSPLGINVITAMAYGKINNPFMMMKYAFYLYALAILTLLAIRFDLLKTKEERENKEFYLELN